MNSCLFKMLKIIVLAFANVRLNFLNFGLHSKGILRTDEI
jgi:hypothetical protein